MPKSTKSLLQTLSIVFSVIFICQSYNRISPQNESLMENYKIQKMNLYPPETSRLANIIEARPEFAFYFHLEKNFTEIFNLSKLFSNYAELAILLLALTIITKLFLSKPKLAMSLSWAPLIALTLFSGTKTDLVFLFLPLTAYSLVSFYD